MATAAIEHGETATGVVSNAHDRQAGLTVRLLGQSSVRLAGTDLPGFESSRLQLLLARLLVGGPIPQSRQHVAFSLWPDSTDVQARTNLRHLLHHLRNALPEPDRYLELSRTTIQWRADSAAWVDVEAFQEAVRQAKDAESDRLARRWLKTAADAYGGDLLPGSYDDWVLAERERLRSSAVTVLDQLAGASEDDGDLDGAMQSAQALVRLDPTHEPSYRRLMRLYGAAGDRARSLRVFHECVRALDRAAGVSPSSATQAVYRSLLEASPALTLTAAAPRLVGRDGDLAMSHAVWREALSGPGRMLLVTGEPGIGKSRLLEELADALEGDGVRVARSRAYAAEGRLAYAPVTDWLKSPTLWPTVSTLDPTWRGEVARLLPQLSLAALPSAPEPVSEGAKRARLFDGLRHALLSSHQPTLLVVDDLQWCDADTLAFLHYFVRESGSAPVMVAGSARTEEVDAGHPLSTVATGLHRVGLLTEIALGPLDAESTAELGRRLRGADLSRQEASNLYAESEGSPLFIVEAIRVAGARSAEGGRGIVQPTVSGVLQARLGQLTPPTRKLVELCATIGRAFSLELLETAWTSEQSELVDALDELWRRRIVREQGDAYDFTHDRLRDVALDAISPVRRRSLHATVANAMAELHRDDPDRFVAELATHYEKAGRIREAIAADRRAATHAQSLFATDEVIAALRRALHLVARLPADREREETELAVRTELAVPLVSRFGYGSKEVREQYTQVGRLARKLGAEITPSAERGLGLLGMSNCQFEEAAQRAASLVRRGAAGDPISLVEGHYLFGVSDFWRARFAESEGHLREAMSRYNPDECDTHLRAYAQDPYAVCASRLAVTVWWRGDDDEAVRLMAEAKRYASEIRDPFTLAYVACWEGWLALLREDDEQVAATARAGAQLWTGRTPFFEPMGDLLRGWVQVRHGKRAGVRLIRKAAETYRDPARQLYLTFVLAVLGRALALTGSPTEALTAVGEARTFADRTGQRYLDSDLLRLEGELHIATGDADLGTSLIRRAIAVARDQGAGAHQRLAERSLLTAG